MTAEEIRELSGSIDRPIRIRLRGGETAEIVPLFVVEDEREVIYRLLSTSDPGRYKANPCDQVYLTEFEHIESLQRS